MAMSDVGRDKSFVSMNDGFTFYDEVVNPMGYGTIGRPIALQSNHLEITTLEKGRTIYVYSVEIHEIKAKRDHPTSADVENAYQRYKRNISIKDNSANRDELAKLWEMNSRWHDVCQGAEIIKRVARSDERFLIFFTAVANDHRGFFNQPEKLSYDSQNTVITVDKAFRNGLANDKSYVEKMYVPLKLRNNQRFYRVQLKYQTCADLALLGNDNASKLGIERFIATIVTNSSSNPYVQSHGDWINGRTTSLLKEPLTDLGANVALYAGVRTSVVPANNYSLAVDLSMSPVQIGGITLIEYICRIYKEIFGACTIADLCDTSIMTPAEWRTLSNMDAFKGLILTKNSVPEMERTSEMHLHFVCFSSNADTFRFKRDKNAVYDDESLVSVTQYYKERYGYTLKYPKLPCVAIARNDTEALKAIKSQNYVDLAHFPLEVLNIQGPRRLRNFELSAQQLQTVIRQAAMPPSERHRHTLEICRRFLMKETIEDIYGLKIGTNFSSVAGRVLPPPTLFFRSAKANTAKLIVDDPKMASFKFNPSYMVKAAPPIQHVVCVEVAPRQSNIQSIFYKLKNIANRGLGMKWMAEGPLSTTLKVNNIPNALHQMPQYLLGILSQLSNTDRKRTIVLVLIPAQNAEFYYTLKHLCDDEYGVASQVILAKNCEKILKGPDSPVNQTAFNILLKINLKMGGVNWMVGPPEEFTASNKCGWHEVVGKGDGKAWLIVAMDISSPQPRIEDLFKTPTVISFVANQDKLVSKFITKTEFIKKIDLSTFDFAKPICELFDSYVNAKTGDGVNGLPSGIMLLVDIQNADGGVERIADMQLRDLTEAIAKKYNGYKPEYLYVTQNKRHAHRLYVKNINDGVGRMGNIPAGTVVDTPHFLSATHDDFLLASHGGIQGTSKPSRVRVVCNTSNFTANDVQIIMQCLAYNWQRATKGISIAGPLRLAKTVAERKTQIIAKVNPDNGGYVPSNVTEPKKPIPFSGSRRIESGKKDNVQHSAAGLNIVKVHTKGPEEMIYTDKLWDKAEKVILNDDVLMSMINRMHLSPHHSFDSDSSVSLDDVQNRVKVRRGVQRLYAAYAATTDFIQLMIIAHSKNVASDERLKKGQEYANRIVDRIQFDACMEDKLYSIHDVYAQQAPDKKNQQTLEDVINFVDGDTKRLRGGIEEFKKLRNDAIGVMKAEGIHLDDFLEKIGADQHMKKFVAVLEKSIENEMVTISNGPLDADEFDDFCDVNQLENNEEAVQIYDMLAGHAVLPALHIHGKERAIQVYNKYFRSQRYEQKCKELRDAALQSIHMMNVSDTSALSAKEQQDLDNALNDYKKAVRFLKIENNSEDREKFIGIRDKAMACINELMSRGHCFLTAYTAFIGTQKVAEYRVAQARRTLERHFRYRRINKRKTNGENGVTVNIPVAKQCHTHENLTDRQFCM